MLKKQMQQVIDKQQLQIEALTRAAREEEIDKNRRIAVLNVQAREKDETIEGLEHILKNKKDRVGHALCTADAYLFALGVNDEEIATAEDFSSNKQVRSILRLRRMIECI